MSTLNRSIILLWCFTTLFFACQPAASESPLSGDGAWVEIEDGLQYRILQAGSGEAAKAGDNIFFHELFRYLHGEEILFSTFAANSPVQVQLGTGRIIEGLERGLTGMLPGERRELIIPPHFSRRFGDKKFPAPDSTLRYEVELLSAAPTDFGYTFPEPSQENSEAAAVLYRSVDGGKKWFDFADGLPEEAVVSAMASTDAAVLVATDYHGVFALNLETHVWEDRNTGFPGRIDINALMVAGEHLYAGTFRKGIFRAPLSGGSWEQVAPNLKGISIRALLPVGKKLLAGTDNGIFQSTDGGRTWEHNFGDYLQVNGFDFSGSIIYAAVVNGLLVSTDEGNNWGYAYQESTCVGVASNLGSIYLATMNVGLLQSVDQGKSWSNINQGFSTDQHYTFGVETTGSNPLAAQVDGVYEYSNRGHLWIPVEGPWPVGTPFFILKNSPVGLLAGTGKP